LFLQDPHRTDLLVSAHHRLEYLSNPSLGPENSQDNVFPITGHLILIIVYNEEVERHVGRRFIVPVGLE